MVQESTNTFSDGLISDLNPLTTPNTVLTDALNATLLTFNGNELVLQNDMGNAKIEGCKLTEGFIPLGIKEYGGILYIVSNNPKTNEIEIGSFPSPKPTKLTDISTTEVLQVDINMDENGNITNTTIPLLNTNIKLSNTRFHPGDKFIIFLNINNLSAISSTYNSTRKFYKLKLLSIEKGIETDITNTLVNQKIYTSNNIFENSNYWFVPSAYPSTEELTKYDQQNYVQIYQLRKSGQLYLRIELENIDDLKIKNTTNFLGSVLSNLDISTLLQIDSNTFSDVELIGDGTKSINELITDYNNINGVTLFLKSSNFIPKDQEIIKFTKSNQNSIYPILQLTNESGVFDNNFYLNFNLYLKALSQIKIDTIEIKLQIIDLNGDNQDSYVTKNITLSDFLTDEYQLNNILFNVGQSNNVVVIYTISCKNIYYDIEFEDFVIRDILDLSIDPSQWGNSENSDYEFYDYDLFDYLTI